MRTAALTKLLELAKRDPRILFAASDVAKDVVAGFLRETPRQVFIEGIAEGHLVGMASGLAKEGSIVFVNTIASFLTKRAFEQIAVNACLENVNVKLLGQGGGLVYGGQGSTHHALEDIAILRTLPNMTILVPCDAEQTKLAVEAAVQIAGPVYIRLAKGSSPIVSQGQAFVPGQPIVYKKPERVLFISMGIMTQTALASAEKIPGSGVIQVHTLKPFDGALLQPYLDSVDTVVTLEEHSSIGGLGSCVCETIVKHCKTKPRLIDFSLGDGFVRDYGKQEELLQNFGLDRDRIVAAVERGVR